jgi:GT2 family glycosyltransferase
MAPASPLRIAAIIVTWNSESVIGQCLESIRSSVFDGQIEMIVVDNASDDDTIRVVEERAPEALIVHTGRNAGYAAGINAGMGAARRADAYLLLNPDLRVDPHAVQALADALVPSDAGIVVPRLVDGSGMLRFSLRREPTALRAWGEALLGGTRAGLIPALGEVEMRPEVYELSSRPDWATGAAMLISSECAEKVGAWDETYFLYSEETDFALRARDIGFAIQYVPGAEAVHFEGESHQSPALFSLLEHNRVKLYRSRHNALAAATFWAGVVVGDMIRFASPMRRAAFVALLGVKRAMAAPTRPITPSR